MKNLVEIYCLSDDLVKYLESDKHVGRPSSLSKAEYITLALMKQEYGIKTNKKLYNFVKYCIPTMFSKLPSYAQFNEGLNSILPHMLLLLKIWMQINKSRYQGVYYVDSTTMPICSNAHRYRVKIDLGMASSGKNIYGWFHGFKLHMIINYNMEIVSIKFTTGSANDLKSLDEKLTKDLVGILVGDKGYISAKKKKVLAKQGLTLITKPRKNMPHPPATFMGVALLKGRQRIETVFGSLKNHFSLINRYARSLVGYFSQAIAALLAYCNRLHDVKPDLVNYLIPTCIS